MIIERAQKMFIRMVASSYPLASTHNALSRPWLHKETSDDRYPIHLQLRSMMGEVDSESLTASIHKEVLMRGKREKGQERQEHALDPSTHTLI